MAERVGAFFEDHRESRDLGRAALRSGVVSVAIQYGNAALQITAAIILARLLAPEDFGLVAIVTVLTSFAPLLIEFGLIDATAQRTTVTPSQVSGLFWVSTGLGVGIAVVVAGCGPLIASLYDEPRLQPIALVTSMTLRGVGRVKSAHRAAAARDAVRQDRPDPVSRYAGRHRRRGRLRNARTGLLGAGTAAARQCLLRRGSGLDRMPVEARRSDL